MTETNSALTFEGWAMLELLGHRVRAGYCICGEKLIRIDIPVDDKGTIVTEFYGVSAVYSMRPCTEELARKKVATGYDTDPRPIRALDYRPENEIDEQEDN